MTKGTVKIHVDTSEVERAIKSLAVLFAEVSELLNSWSPHDVRYELTDEEREAAMRLLEGTNQDAQT